MVKSLNFLLRLSPFSLYPIPVLKKCKKPDDVLFINAAGELTRWFGRRPTTPIPCGLPAAVDLPSAISAVTGSAPRQVLRFAPGSVGLHPTLCVVGITQPAC